MRSLTCVGAERTLVCNRLSPQTRSVCIAHQSQHPIIIVAYSPNLNPDHLSKLSWLELKMHLKDLRVKICQSVLKLEGLESRLFVCSALPTWTPPSYMRPSPPPLPAALSGCNNDCSHVALIFLLLQCFFRKGMVFSPQLPVMMAKMCAGKV